MSTPNGNLIPYCTVAQFLQRYDWRTISDYINDEGQRYSKLDALQLGTVPNMVIYTLLQEGAGDIEAVCLRGDRYTATDLLSLTGNSQQLLVGLNADVTLPKILDRRPDLTSPTPKRLEQAMNIMAALESGEAVFALQEVTDAGLASHQIETPIDPIQRNLTTKILRRMFGQRTADRNQYPAS
jgi:hypothetical protein